MHDRFKRSSSANSARRRSRSDQTEETGGNNFHRSYSHNNTGDCRQRCQLGGPSIPLPPPPPPLDNGDDPWVLPTIKTCTVTKGRPDQACGLLLTLAKNGSGAVVVQSLSPDSLFRKSTALHPGVEVLSVNEKRVNDPKMAATLITQAKKKLSLRISTVERRRGFIYCQVKRRKGDSLGDAADGAAPASASAAGKNNERKSIQFVTTSVSGVRRGTISDGLVRISYIDPKGLFANSHPTNRLRVGSIVLTVNGAPVTNGRSALEKVMESRQLVEVLHFDERVWREDFVRDGLNHIKTTSSLDDNVNNNGAWDFEWGADRGEVTLRKKKVKGEEECHCYAFKLIFNNDVGTCHPELVDDETMMPPADEFDVLMLVKLVNDSQKNMMTTLQNMLRKANLEMNRYKKWQQLPWRVSNNKDISRESTALASNILTNDDHQQRGNHIIVGEHGGSGADEELSQLAESLNCRFDGNATERRAISTTTTRRGSTGFSDVNIDVRGAVDNNDDPSTTEAGTNGSMFRTGMIEEFMDYLDDVGAAHDMKGAATPSNSSYETCKVSSVPPSPRDDVIHVDKKLWKDGALCGISSSMDQELDNDTNNNHCEDDTSPSEEKKGDDEMAYITGVWRDVGSKYEITDKVVGSGGFGEVRECYDKKNKQINVVKTISKPERDDTTKINLIRNEILLLHEANHSNIVELRDLFEDDECVHIVMERCTGGDLFDQVVNENPRMIRSISKAMKHEARTAHTMRSILNVLKYLHHKGIVHRDIKPEHFLLQTEEGGIKLIDFGLARRHKAGSAPMTTFTGSASFVAPEVIGRSYDHKCDMFSVGVTAYFLLTGALPFDGSTDEETFDLIVEGVFEFPSSSIVLSDDAKDFVTQLLKIDPNERLSAGEALNHPWLIKYAL